MRSRSLGDRVRELRERAGISQRELDRLADLGEGHVGQIESGVKPNPTVRIAEKIAGALGCSLDWLVGGTGPAPWTLRKAEPGSSPHLARHARKSA